MKYLGRRDSQQDVVSRFIKEVLGLSDLNLCYFNSKNLYRCKSSSGRLNTIKYYPLVKRLLVTNYNEWITLDLSVAKYNKWVFKEVLYSERYCTSGFGKYSQFFQTLISELGKHNCEYVLKYLDLVSFAYNMISFRYLFTKNSTQWELLIQRILGQEKAVRISLQESLVPSRNISKSSLYSFKQRDELSKIGVQCAKLIKETLDEAYRKEQ